MQLSAKSDLNKVLFVQSSNRINKEVVTLKCLRSVFLCEEYWDLEE